MKTILKLLCLFALATYFILAITVFNKPQKGVACSGVDFVIEDSLQTGFICENDLQELLVKAKLFPTGKPIEEISLKQLEETLTKSPYIKEALCYQAATGQIHIKVTPLQPVLYIISTYDEKSYYIDGQGTVMPAQSYTADVPLATGHITAQYAKKNLASLGRYILNNEFWNKQIQQIHVWENGDIELVPRVGEHTILLGHASGYRDKLSRMKLFYTEGLNKVGWNRYSTINLKYADQIICTRKKK